MSTQVLAEQLFAAAAIRLTDSSELYPALHSAGQPGLPMLVIDNPLARAVIALQGAHLMAFKPAGEPEMLWVSPKCVLEAGKPIRGGIPLCLPWFGPGPDGKTLHGFARTSAWSLLAAEALPGGATRVVLGLSGDAAVSALWPHAFAFRLEFIVGKTLQLTLSAENRSAETAPLAFAFHTYFAVPKVADARIGGLAGTHFIDKTDNMARKVQDGEVTISAVTDRVYLDVPARQTISAGAQRIAIDSAAKCAVVWNAWTNDANIADLGAGNHVGYLCVERGDVADYAVSLAPGAKYALTMTLSS
jgi:D-hexose-6-phosphate mutarotase